VLPLNRRQRAIRIVEFERLLLIDNTDAPV
jgi:hypothetical protein